jgi:DNA-binding transcriptional MerR regulator
MIQAIPVVNVSEAAKRLGVSIKALRVYEQRGLLTPGRTAAGYRTYGPDDMARAGEVVSLRALGLSLAQIARVLEGDPQSLDGALTVHESTLESKIRQLADSLDKIRRLRTELARGQLPTGSELALLQNAPSEFRVAFELPPLWGREWFELRDIRPLNYIVGPLGSGKTQLAQLLAEKIPDAAFLGLERAADMKSIEGRLNGDAALKSRVDRTMAWLMDEGATESPALTALLVSVESDDRSVLIVDMVEQGLDKATQESLAAYLRHRAKAGGRTLFLMTRSSAILDLSAIGPDEALILCPANHSPPMRVAPYRGALGFEAVAMCLASPEVRARTTGTIAWRPIGYLPGFRHDGNNDAGPVF